MLENRIWEKPVSHGEILKKIWKNLDLGTLERDHPFHTPVFSTVASGCVPNLRVVVLRRFWRKPPQLAFHTHMGSPKIKELETNPNVYWLFYHTTERIQVRVKGRATIHTDDLAEEQWLATEFFSRRCYVGEAPTQTSKKPTSGLPEDLIDRAPTREESETGRANFAVVTSTIEQIDCLEMNVRGHRRSLVRVE